MRKRSEPGTATRDKVARRDRNCGSGLCELSVLLRAWLAARLMMGWLFGYESVGAIVRGIALWKVRKLECGFGYRQFAGGASGRLFFFKV